MRNTRYLLAACVLLAACDGSPTEGLPLDDSYVLMSGDGQPVPFELVRWQNANGQPSDIATRVTGRTLEFLPRDSVRYGYREDVVQYMPGGGVTVLAGQCTIMTVPYRVVGSRVIVVVDPLGFGGEPSPIRLDTLDVQNGNLVHMSHEAGRTIRLEYHPAPVTTPLCEVA